MKTYIANNKYHLKSIKFVFANAGTAGAFLISLGSLLQRINFI